MHSLIKKSVLVLAVAFVAIQFIPIAKNISTVGPEPDDITVLHPTPPAIKAMLAESCYDCHSNNTRYPWYTHIQPVGWWMQRHVDEGIKELNFSQFGTYSNKRARHKLEELVDITQDREMPLSSYLIAHRQAKLSDQQIQQLADWANGIRSSIPAPATP